MKRKKLLINVVGVLATLSIFTGSVFAGTPSTATQTIDPVVAPQDQYRENLAYSIGIQAYLYGFPLVDMVKTMQIAMQKTPLNTFSHMRRLADPSDRDIVAPNNDTLYSQAWLDLSKGPVVFSIPKAEPGRYFSFQFLDAYTNTFRYIGTRLKDTNAAKYVIVGPNWKGKFAKGTKVIQSPTNMVWLLGRTLVKEEKDLANVYAIQNKYTLAPLNKKQAKPLIDLKTTISESDFNDPARYFDIMTRSMKLFPGPSRDESMLSQFKLIGIDPNKGFQGSNDSATMAGLTRALKDAREIMLKSLSNVGTESNHWTVFNKNIGTYGTNYLNRASIAAFGLGSHLPIEAIYSRTTFDSDGKPLSGDHQYVIHIDKKQMLPVNGFWSLSLYGPDQLFVDNPINRYSIGDRTEGLKYNNDGSLDLYIQNSIPEGHESNWLPAPTGNFVLVMRLYEPKQILLDGLYTMPSVQNIK
ncbi:DUF1254 domain-containing protein [Gottfriedia acidiceleris]|uniref:DUF1254 domain-containing protein n=1 Tax=Gottfriedia acidiceleris TaxID=371036 RepID=UPI000B444192|nr:DUF1254 domain-containing protein [Gottfriedia acidiceleris]